MHLLLAAVSSATSPSGVCRHAANIARGMLASSSVRKVTLLAGEWQTDYFRKAFGLENDRLEILPVSISNHSVSRNLWYLRGLPAASRTSGADIVHLAFPIPLLRFAYTAPVVASLHDLYPFDIPRNFGRRAWLNRATTKNCLRNADAIACVSDETRTRVHELFPAMISGKTSVIPNSISLSREFCCTPLPDAIRDCPFLLCVAQHRANKNLPLLLRSFCAALDRNIISSKAKLVLVGNEGPETKLLQQVIEECRIEDRVLFLRGISDTLLWTLYANCELVVAPSLLEGFGLPVAEALTAGSRVVCSNIAVFRSIGAGRCVFFDPLDVTGESLLSALQVARNVPRSMTTSPIGLDPQQAAIMYLSLYSKLLVRKQTHVIEPLSADLPASGDL